ncbi:DUF885 domain-containing protein [Sphingosinicella rhizophila]|uniref:DUF885 family protein n=1 Tax=Sphingosinicella rhizophila TaxID=3050082 RepID=A0ABU3QBB4_9SPHN|nr:DUF885 family protein [Sphingosinicella sp. GR2756]MDT9600686.1 DUF885 family protein [Sphingosinicella sp. GR2756]
MIDRRIFLGSAGAAALLSFARVPAVAAGMQSTTAAGADLRALMDHIYHDIVLADPELRTSLGLDTGEGAWAKSKLQDRSAQALARDRAKVRAAYARLQAIDRDALAGPERIDYDTVAQLYGTVTSGYDQFDYGTFSWPEPYSVSQLGGTYNAIPDFLASQHRIETREDADAYLARLADFAVQADNENARLRGEYAMGVIPPDFVVARTIALIGNLTAVPAAQSGMVTSLAMRAKAKGIPGDWAARAATILDKQVYPALARQADLFRSIQARAPHDAGVWRLPEGEAYYAYALRYATTTGMGAEEIHRLGLDQMADLSARADAVLKAEGLTRGTVAQRIRALGTDPRFLYPDSDAGREILLADLNRQLAAMQQRLPDWFGRLPRAGVEIKRIPPETEAGAPGGYYQSPALDGSRPGAYYINLRDTAELPKWSLPTLTYHESLPGHHLQIALSQESAGIHPLRRLSSYSVYTEGWGLYAEQLADEMGVYEQDPFGKIGYLQSFMFRAARLVVDTGLHHKRWSREQGIRYMAETMGDAETTIATEVERYCVWPGQATSYKVGQTQWSALREQARSRLGDRFDIKGFHDTALAAGAVPLTVLDQVIDDWVKARTA